MNVLHVYSLIKSLYFMITESLNIFDGKQIQERSLKTQYKYIQTYRFSYS